MNITTNTLIQGMNTLAKVFLGGKRMKKRRELAVNTHHRTRNHLENRIHQPTLVLVRLERQTFIRNPSNQRANLNSFWVNGKFQTLHILSKRKENKKNGPLRPRWSSGGPHSCSISPIISFQVSIASRSRWRTNLNFFQFLCLYYRWPFLWQIVSILRRTLLFRNL